MGNHQTSQKYKLNSYSSQDNNNSQSKGDINQNVIEFQDLQITTDFSSPDRKNNNTKFNALDQIQYQRQAISQNADDLGDIENAEQLDEQTQNKSIFQKLKPLFGMLTMIVSIAINVVVMIFFKNMQQINSNYTFSEHMLVRGYFQVFLQAVQYKLMKVDISQVEKSQYKYLFYRCCLSAITMYSYWFALQKLSISLLSVIFFISPFITLVIAFICLKERMTLIEVINMLLCFGSIVAIVYNTQQSNHDENTISEKQIDNSDILSLIFAVLSSFSCGVNYVVMRQLKNVHCVVTNGVYGLVLMFLSTSQWLMFRYDNQKDIVSSFFTQQQLIMIVLIGFLSNFSNQLSIVACQLDKAGRIASLNFVQIPLSYIIDFFIFSYSINFIEFIGASIIVICSFVSMVLKYLNLLD